MLLQYSSVRTALGCATALVLSSCAAESQDSEAEIKPETTISQLETSGCYEPGWVEKSDAAFARDCVDVAFNAGLREREFLAWMFFTRVNQLVDDPTHGGMSDSGQVPIWMTWATDPDTFDDVTPFDFEGSPRGVMKPSTKKTVLNIGGVATADPDGANEEVTRNAISYDYLRSNNLVTTEGVAEFFESNDYVNMPIGSVELKASWLQVTPGSPVPEGALTFKFDHGEYWWRGLHIMVKMRNLDDPSTMFYSEEPSWFWTTFEFNGNPGVDHVRDNLITERSPLEDYNIEAMLSEGGIAGFGFENLSPNGTQIRFTVDGTGGTPVILGHTDMEDFAGSPNTAQPQYWTRFQASCHACHASASYNPETEKFFPFSVPAGALTPAYNQTDKKNNVHYLGQNFKPLDFMWPIAFQAREVSKKDKKKSN